MQPCADLAELLSAFADGQTCPAQSEYIGAHLEQCGGCRVQLDWHLETASLLRQAPDDDWTPPDLRLRVAHACSGRQRGAPRLLLLVSTAISVATLGCMLQLGSAQVDFRGVSPIAATTPTLAAAILQAPCGPCAQDTPIVLNRFPTNNQVAGRQGSRRPGNPAATSTLVASTDKRAAIVTPLTDARSPLAVRTHFGHRSQYLVMQL